MVIVPLSYKVAITELSPPALVAAPTFHGPPTIVCAHPAAASQITAIAAAAMVVRLRPAFPSLLFVTFTTFSWVRDIILIDNVNFSKFIINSYFCVNVYFSDTF
jgi:hypothetical protein